MHLALEADGPVQNLFDVIEVDVVVQVVHRQELVRAELAVGRGLPEVVVLQMPLVNKYVGQVEVATWTTEPSFRNFFLEKVNLC